MSEFNPAQFNTIGIKLAQKAGVPVVPLALLTDAWENGFLIKDFGRINTMKKAHFAFGKPLMIKNRGAEEHQQTIDFIATKLQEWKKARKNVV
jgi:1-acyl-sn-glycerol-3-phosphate acyltransferase